MSLGNDQYPKTLIEANNVLSNHKFDDAYYKQNSSSRKVNEVNNSDNRSNTDDTSPPLSFAQMEGKCYCCGKPGHKSPACNKKKQIPRSEWAINKMQSPAQMMNQNEGNEISNISDNNSRGGPPQNIGTPSVASGSNNAQ